MAISRVRYRVKHHGIRKGQKTTNSETENGVIKDYNPVYVVYPNEASSALNQSVRDELEQDENEIEQ